MKSSRSALRTALNHLDLDYIWNELLLCSFHDTAFDHDVTLSFGYGHDHASQIGQYMELKSEF